MAEDRGIDETDKIDRYLREYDPKKGVQTIKGMPVHRSARERMYAPFADTSVIDKGPLFDSPRLHQPGLRCMESLEVGLKVYMYRIGDFNPRHYKVVADDYNQVKDGDDGKYTFTVGYRFEYVATEKERRKAKTMLRSMYGKKVFDELAQRFHPFMFILDEKPKETGR